MSRGDIRLRAPDGAYNLIGARLREQRLKRKMTQDAVCARLADVTGRRWIADRFDIRKLEKGIRTATCLEIFALAAAVECDPLYLFAGEETPTEVLRKLIAEWTARPAIDPDR